MSDPELDLIEEKIRVDADIGTIDELELDRMEPTMIYNEMEHFCPPE